MTQQQNVPDPELFTKEIEDTIDSLFTPTKEIEIDPVTNEIRELKREPTSEDTVEELQPPKVEAEEEEELTLELEEEESVETLELEGTAEEIEEVSPTLEVQAEEAPSGGEELEQMEHQFNQLYQSLLTLEWEFTKEDLSNSYEILKNIAQKIDSLGSKDAELIINSMLRIMGALKEDPEGVSPNAPKALEMGLEAVMALAREKDQPLEETKEKVKKAKEFMALVRFGEEARKERGAVTREKVQPLPQEPEKVVEVPVKESTTPSTSATTPEINHARLQAVIDDLSNCVERIIPVQELLSKHKKSQKLYKFLEGIRSGIESSIEVLCSELRLEVPEIRVEKVAPKDLVTGFTTTISREPPPFNEILVFSWDGERVGLLADEVAYIGPVLGFGKKVNSKDRVFSLSVLKKWPWSKVKSVVGGELARLDESRLRSLALPIITRPDLDESSLEEKTPKTWILLYRDEKGVAIPADEEPKRITVDKESKWLPDRGEESKWLGTISLENEVIKVFSLEKVFESL